MRMTRHRKIIPGIIKVMTNEYINSDHGHSSMFGRHSKSSPDFTF